MPTIHVTINRNDYTVQTDVQKNKSLQRFIIHTFEKYLQIGLPVFRLKEEQKKRTYIFIPFYKN